MNDHWDRPLLVTGLPRSGTSLVAGLLAESGVWVGRTVPGGPPNPRGFFEHVVLREEIDKGLLRALGCDPLGVTSLPPMTLPPVDNLRETVHRVLAREGYDGHRPWLFKDAKLTLLWPLWAQAFPRARWLIVRRAREDVIRSCLRTHFMAQHGLDERQWQRWAEAYEQRLGQLRRRVCWWREIWPQRLVRGDFQALELLVRELGLPPRPARWARFVLPDSWHAQNPKTAG